MLVRLILIAHEKRRRDGIADDEDKIRRAFAAGWAAKARYGLMLTWPALLPKPEPATTRPAPAASA